MQLQGACLVLPPGDVVQVSPCTYNTLRSRSVLQSGWSWLRPRALWLGQGRLGCPWSSPPLPLRRLPRTDTPLLPSSPLQTPNEMPRQLLVFPARCSSAALQLIALGRQGVGEVRRRGPALCAHGRTLPPPPSPEFNALDAPGPSSSCRATHQTADAAECAPLCNCLPSPGPLSSFTW